MYWHFIESNDLEQYKAGNHDGEYKVIDLQGMFAVDSFYNIIREYANISEANVSIRRVREVYSYKSTGLANDATQVIDDFVNFANRKVAYFDFEQVYEKVCETKNRQNSLYTSDTGIDVTIGEFLEMYEGLNLSHGILV